MSKLIPPPELTLDFKPTFVPQTITQFLGEMATISSVSDKILKFDDFISRLETEIRKIDAFKRELPLCMLLMNDAIVALKEELMVFKKSANQPVLEEFIPLNKTCDEDPEVEADSNDKKNWLSSTQLWNTIDNNSDTNHEHIPKPNSVEQVIQKILQRTEEQQDGRTGDLYSSNSLREFIPFNGYCGFPVVGTRKSENKDEIHVPEISLIAPCSILNVRSNKPQPPQQQQSRKQRRCWSTELHRRFVSALQQLGGSKAATPKQIRELMRVDGLTNDEVKSHLQKYRLHTKRLPSYNASSNSPPAALGCLWNPPHDHYVEKSLHSQSGSPDGPLLNCTTATGGTSTTGGDSMDDGDDEKSESNCWRGHLNTSGKDSV